MKKARAIEIATFLADVLVEHSDKPFLRLVLSNVNITDEELAELGYYFEDEEDE